MKRGNMLSNGTVKDARRIYEQAGICYVCGKRLHVEDPQWKHNECQCAAAEKEPAGQDKADEFSTKD